MKQLDLFDNFTQKPTEPLNQEVISARKELSTKANELMNGVFQFVVSKGKYSSYKIETEKNHLSKVLFSIGEEKFQIYIDYSFEKRNFTQINYTETNPEDREIVVRDFKIKNLKITGMQRKVKVGYWELKQSPNYFKHVWVDYHSIIIFLEEVIKKYHINS